VVFGLLKLMPGDIAITLAGENATDERINEIREMYGLNRPFLVQYGSWLGHAITGDLSKSLASGEAVATSIARSFPNTLLIVLLAMGVAMGVGIPLGILAASKPDSLLDRVVTSIASLGIAVPSFWLALVLIYIFAVRLGWLPAGGMPQTGEGMQGWLIRLILPLTALVMVEIGGLTRYARSAMLDVLGQDYIRTARAKGLSTSRLLYRHALRNSMIPVVTIIALGFGHLFSGALLIENMFAWRGMGRLILEAIMGNDYNLALVCLLFTTAMILVANILADLAYTWLDPRISLGGRRK
jgi:peptide/nickel transport system permease protein